MSDNESDIIDTKKQRRKGLFFRRWFRRLVLIVVILIVFIVASTIYLSPTDPLQKADAIVAISGGDTYARTMEAVQLYHAGWAPKIIFSGAALDPDSPSNAEVMKQIALGSGVPISAVETDKEARNTAQNASGSHQLLPPSDHTIILVTSQYHQRRASIQFAKIFGSQVKIINQPAADYYWNEYTWWTTPQGWYLTLSELVKIPVVMVRGH